MADIRRSHKLAPYLRLFRKSVLPNLLRGNFLAVGIGIYVARHPALLIPHESQPTNIVTRKECVLCHRLVLLLGSSPQAEEPPVLDADLVNVLVLVPGPIVLSSIVLEHHGVYFNSLE